MAVSPTARDERVTALLRPDGTIEYRSGTGTKLLESLDEATRRAIAQRASCEGAAAGIVDGVAWEVVPMLGHDERRFLLTLKRVSCPPPCPLAALTPRRRQVAEYAATGATIGQIAEALGTSPETVRTQLKSVYHKLGIASRVELVQLLNEAPRSGRGRCD